jgi:pimeloyl-ACP methyl ester carboxylesterase
MRAWTWGIAVALALVVAGPGATQTPAWQTLKDPVQLVAPRQSGLERVGDVELYYAVYGEGRPVILLHDALGNSNHWANQVGPLSLTNKVIVIDSRGHGRSTRGDKPFSYRLMSEDVFALMRKLEAENATVVGWGDGAIVGLELAMRHPGWVRKLVMFGGYHNLTGLKADVEKTATFGGYVRKSVAEYKELSPAADFDRLLSDLRVMWKREPSYTARELRRVKTPTVVVIAEHDETVKTQHSRELADMLDNSQTVFLPGLSHYAPWQDSARFNEAVKLAVDY